MIFISSSVIELIFVFRSSIIFLLFDHMSFGQYFSYMFSVGFWLHVSRKYKICSQLIFLFETYSIESIL
ncbi:MAG: hypothetical protein ACD_2C00144G0003 [uncultured bacterium (gcode 4)]|uniref:Uncharacterized protein n=1 Tax=uncultured bacterium (gcode 4) TaxID=1234023 RepID=K2G2Y5_9BACT|nr:MAG: hypothetical protein ACD_2C00144G0003 [uncultured bacterium (gcode 4)]